MDIKSAGEIFALSMKYIGSGIAVGVGAIGPGIGKGFTAEEAVLGEARQPKAENLIMRTMLIGQAVAENSGVFALVISIMLLFVNLPLHWSLGFAYLGAGIAVGLGGIGSANAQGVAAASAVKAVARRPSKYEEVMKTMLIGQSMASTPSIFALLVSLILMLGVKPVGVLKAIAYLSAGIAMGAAAYGPGEGCGFSAAEACEQVVKTKTSSMLILRTMMIGQAVAQSTAVYGLVIAFILIFFKF